MTPQRRFAFLFTLAAAAAVIFVALYIALVLSRPGQYWDDRAYLGRPLMGEDTARALRNALNLIQFSTVALMVIVLIVVGLVRKLPITTLLAASGFALTILSAEALKALLPRPDLAPALTRLTERLDMESYPSGHSAIAMSFALALIMVSSPRARTWVTLGGMAWAGFITMGTVAAGWHRPGDALGGIAIASAWMFASAGLAVVAMARTTAPTRSPRVVWLQAALMWGGAVLVTGIWSLYGYVHGIWDGGSLHDFALAEGLVAACALVAIAAFTSLIGPLTLSPEPTPRPAFAS